MVALRFYSEASEKAPLSGCYEIFGVPHLDEANGPPLGGTNPKYEAKLPKSKIQNKLTYLQFETLRNLKIWICF